LTGIAHPPVAAFGAARCLLVIATLATKEEEEALMLSRRLFAAGAAGAPAILADAARAEEQPAESIIDRIKRTKVLRIAALPGEAPYFNKDIASGNWSGMCTEMAKDIAGVFDGQVESRTPSICTALAWSERRAFARPTGAISTTRT
jgi:hypothetical protein